MSEEPFITARFPIRITDAYVECPLCGHFLMPVILALHNGRWYQIHFYVTYSSDPQPTFCAGHSKYDPVFYHEPAEQRTPVPAIFHEAFQDEEVEPGE